MMTVEEALRHLGTPVTAELQEFAERTSRGFLWKSRLHGRIRTYRCSLCGAEWEYDDRAEADVYQHEAFSGNLIHWQQTSCPNCERTLNVYEEWRGARKIGYKEHFVEHWRRSAIDPDVLIGVGALAQRVYPEPGGVCRDAAVRLVSFIVYRYGRAGERFCADGKSFVRMTKINALDANVRGAERYLDDDSLRGAICGTPFARVWCDKMLHASDRSTAGKIGWLSTHPAAEYMLKLGFEQLVYEELNAPYGAQEINWRGKTVEEVFGMDKATVRALRPYGARMGEDALSCYKQLKVNGTTWPAPKLMDTIFELNLSSHSVDRLIGEVKRRAYSLRLELKYLLKQRRSLVRSNVPELTDYWRQCDELDVPADDYRTRHPKDLHRMHEEFGQRIKYKANSRYDEDIAARLEMLERELGFAGEGLILRPAMNTKEIIDEGTKLNHCVGGYCANYANGNTVILVLRREEAPDVPFHTVEMTPGGALVQCRGYGNHTLPQDQELIDRFWAAYRAAKG